MDLYHDEYSVFYEYETSNDETTEEQINGTKTDDTDDVIEIPPEPADVIEVPSDSDDENDVKVKEFVNGRDDPGDSEFDEDYDEEANNTETYYIQTQDMMEHEDDPDMDVRIVGPSETLENNDGTYRCPLCPKEVVSKYNLKRHMMIHTGEKPHKCPTCYKGFREQSDLRKHKKVHIYGNRLFECNICFRSYQSYKANKCYYCDGDDEEIQPPNTYEDDSKLYSCFLCTATQLTVDQLKQHLIQIHPATSRVTYTNSSNGISSNGHTSKSVSRNVEDMEKIHKCNVCTKAFRSKQFLMLHTLTHANNRIESAF